MKGLKVDIYKLVGNISNKKKKKKKTSWEHVSGWSFNLHSCGVSIEDTKLGLWLTRLCHISQHGIYVRIVQKKKKEKRNLKRVQINNRIILNVSFNLEKKK